MSFAEILKESVERVDGAFSAMILGIDGMPVEEYSTRNVINLDDLSAESSQLMKDIGNAAENLSLGEANEFLIVSDLCGIIMHKINSEYYVSMIIKPNGNYGKGRFVLRSLIPRIREEF
jgi:predicted regulator of Ras-like GTPase activity (Roadblock/LC7/MglB family)